MDFKEYEEAAGITINKSLTDKDKSLNAALGLSGESGEFADAIKKNVFHGHELDKEKLAKELGDILWYINLGAKALGYSLDQIAQMNIEKLKKRYPNGFNSHDSINRKE